MLNKRVRRRRRGRGGQREVKGRNNRIAIRISKRKVYRTKWTVCLSLVIEGG
jgi:hypothetical protein